MFRIGFVMFFSLSIQAIICTSTFGLENLLKKLSRFFSFEFSEKKMQLRNIVVEFARLVVSL